MLPPYVTVLGEIRAPRLGILKVVHNEVMDAWQIQLTRDGKEGALMTIVVADGKVFHTKHEDFTRTTQDGINIPS